MSNKNFYVPGTFITDFSENYISGNGTYLKNGKLYSSIIGVLKKVKILFLIKRKKF
jgi:exosome complex RNA-binding protein Rrp4